jgi:hypothetical protein
MAAANWPKTIAAEYGQSNAVQVLFPADHLPAATGPLRRLASADDSRKAGAIILGCMQAIADGAEAVIYTDADNSVHLGQIGCCCNPISRTAVASYWATVNIRIRYWSKMLPAGVSASRICAICSA